MAQQQGQSEAHQAADTAKQEYEDAQKTMEEWEQRDEVPSDLNEWPSDKAKYVTFGGGEGEPIPGGPTDPEAPELAGEKRKREKQERMSQN
jgi:hypothetical protein